MSKLPLLSATELCKVLGKLGFQEVRQKAATSISSILMVERQSRQCTATGISAEAY